MKNPKLKDRRVAIVGLLKALKGEMGYGYLQHGCSLHDWIEQNLSDLKKLARQRGETKRRTGKGKR